MLKIAVTVSLIFVALVALKAQKASVETASLSLSTYGKGKERIDMRIHGLKEAKTHVDKAVENPTTANDPKMWLMRARTYLAIQTDTLGENKKTVISDPDAIETAVNAMVNLHKSDEKDKYTETADAYNAFVGIGVNARYIADVAYNNKDYDRAVKYYELTRKLIPLDDKDLLKRQNISDDGLLYNIATTKKLAKDYDGAKEAFTKLIGKSYNDPWIYLELYDIYLNQENDTASAIETIDKGRRMFEENKNLKYQQIFIYSASGRGDELMQILNESIENDPYNSNNFTLRGKLYRNMGDDDKALEDFKKAVEYNDEDFEAHNELGELYYLMGADKLEEANNLSFSENEKFNQLNAEAKDYFMKSIPSWEKLYTYSTDEKQQAKAGQFLLQMYLKTEQMDKYKELKAEFK